MSPAEILKAARALIERPDRWTQGNYAKAYDGCHVPATSEDAVCFCSVGAICRIVGESEPDVKADEALRVLSACVPAGFMPAVHRPGAAGDLDFCVEHVARFNDRTTEHGAVLALFGRAIALAEKEQT